MRTLILIAWSAAIALGSCAPYDRSGDSMTSGTIKAGIDESYSLMIQSQLEVFKGDYPNANIVAEYGPEGDIIEALLKDSIQAAVITRGLTEDEMAMFRSQQKLPEGVRIATDGVALIVNPNNADSVFTLSQVDSLFTGAITSWSQLGSKQSSESVRIVFDHNKSSNARYINERFLKGQPFPENCFAVHSNEEVIEYVNKNAGAIGVISVSWISDRDDSTSQEFLSKVRVAGIIDPSNAERPTMARKPYQAYIYDKTYPLRREVYAIRTSPRTSVGTGFVSFLRGERGQLIIHKMGMVAEQTPARIIRISE
jgi:phosphate transport system substrate-binding protein